VSSDTPRRIDGGSDFEARFAYSRAVIDDKYVFVAGTTGYDYSRMTIAAEAASQTRQCFHNIATVLAGAGSSLGQIVRIRYILTDRAFAEPCAAVFREFLGPHPPAATLIIAQLLDEAMKVEIEVTATHQR